ncbi:X2-like carbohydrate binding domain-containing protein [Streptomyces sp. IB201691-2A2]|uniref:X2-like carbohydrate binding domain-containing protein n=1 Tax=Streptomyces sp. IB201691-2A2 TaxID=2561920 RepID=UPI0021B109B1|nr:X2-like carbohydrate binding domain-containing protein [Streptomyces sp. IB201691-2A2]
MFVPKSGDITSQTLALNPNTTDFQGLWHEGRELTGGTDYTLSGDQLTLTASHPHTADRRPGARSQNPFPAVPGAWPTYW